MSDSNDRQGLRAEVLMGFGVIGTIFVLIIPLPPIILDIMIAVNIAFATLVQQLRAWSFRLIDCQVVTDHLVRFGAREFALHDFLGRLDQATDERHRPGPWRFDANVLGPPTE